MPRQPPITEKQVARWAERRALILKSDPMPVLPASIRVYDPKTMKRIDREFKLAAKELARMSRKPSMTAEERKQMRAEQQRQRRASKAISEVIL